MSENTAAPAAPKTVRTYRHQVKGLLDQARHLLPKYSGNEGIDAARESLNGAISSVLQGRQGLTQEQQVNFLSTALEKVVAGLSTLPQHLAAEGAEEILTQAGEQAKSEATQRLASVTEQIAYLEQQVADLKAAQQTLQAQVDSAEPVDVADQVMSLAGQAQQVLEEARDFAAERDFAAHQAEKGKPVPTEPAPVSPDDAEYDEDDEDDEDDDED